MNHPSSLPSQPAMPFEKDGEKTQQPVPASVPEQPGEIKPSFPQSYPENPAPGPDSLQP
ncbi:hypothetical protein [Pulveribacter suum]|uniref:hypothetical protein n=1 Tax=Pulveribacter suum TaxID=2116657 RepID=UPI001300346A|nr:hypothetical protein [Pulveribacter suum]